MVAAAVGLALCAAAAAGLAVARTGSSPAETATAAQGATTGPAPGSDATGGRRDWGAEIATAFEAAGRDDGPVAAQTAADTLAEGSALPPARSRIPTPGERWRPRWRRT